MSHLIIKKNWVKKIVQTTTAQLTGHLVANIHNLTHLLQKHFQCSHKFLAILRQQLVSDSLSPGKWTHIGLVPNKEFLRPHCMGHNTPCEFTGISSNQNKFTNWLASIYLGGCGRSVVKRRQVWAPGASGRAIAKSVVQIYGTCCLIAFIFKKR